ncbi:MAG: hypothetical protein AUK37_03965 [Rhodobacterales bacterium CG2_30_65_12]|nr:MAG: hypothetical protein AUK37_03965 [Rhodobacterales bacterium CG2_30_65_12]
MREGGTLLTHPEFTRAFDAALKGAPLPEGVTARAPDQAARRFDVYRNNVAVSLAEALAARFAVIKRLVGEEFFTALARVYAEAHRPRSPVLHEWGESFAGFLATFPPLEAYPYMADVARIEWARGLAFHAADATPADPALFAGANPGRLTLRLHESVQVLRLATPAVSIWAANQPGAAPLDLTAATPEIAMVWRDRSFEVPVLAIGPGDAVLVEQLRAGAPLATAAECALWAETGFDPQPMLVRLMQAGAILTPEETLR